MRYSFKNFVVLSKGETKTRARFARIVLVPSLGLDYCQDVKLFAVFGHVEAAVYVDVKGYCSG